MTYKEGAAKMLQLTQELKENKKKTDSFEVGSFLITYPGKKENGDYRLTENGKAPTHVNIVEEIYQLVQSPEISLENTINDLEDIYQNGLNAATIIFPQGFKEKLYWITLQEDINYPRGAGRRLPFQRFYEAVLAGKEIIDIGYVKERTNNHGKRMPSLYRRDFLDDKQVKTPSFYY